MKYRKKAIEVEAIQMSFPGAYWDRSDWPDWLLEAWVKGDQEWGCLFMGANNTLMIQTLEGYLKVSHGDFIIRGPDGELYPCKPDIFEATYEEVK